MGLIHLYNVYFHSIGDHKLFQVSTCRSNPFYIEFHFLFAYILPYLPISLADTVLYQWNLMMHSRSSYICLGRMYIYLLRFLLVRLLSQKNFSLNFISFLTHFARFLQKFFSNLYFHHQ